MAIDQKYGKVTVEKEPGTPIGEDEPVFLLRAQDVTAVDVLTAYYDNADGVGASDEFLDAIRDVTNTFETWQGDNKNRVKTPD